MIAEIWTEDPDTLSGHQVTPLAGIQAIGSGHSIRYGDPAIRIYGSHLDIVDDVKVWDLSNL